MSIAELERTQLFTARQTRFLYHVMALNGIAQILKDHAPGPAVTGESEQRALLADNIHILRELDATIEDLTRVGISMSAEELGAVRKQAQAIFHPLLLESAFARRSYEKPLGYAGDYVMVNHLLGNPFQGETASGQLLNFALVQTDVAQGHRNRIDVLQELLERHARIGHAEGRKISALTIGCGPAEETYRFIRSSAYAESLELSLMDFNQETLEWTQSRLEQAHKASGKAPTLHYVQDSVYNLAKRKDEDIVEQYDIVVCAGLFDYLTDRFCKRVIEFGVRSLRPGGSLLVTNVSQCRDSFFMSTFLEWDLIYRSDEHLRSLLPKMEGISSSVYVDATGTNVMAELNRA